MRTNIDAVVVSLKSKIVDAIGIIDQSGLQAALVLDGSGILRGIITDGDVRRGLLRGVQLDAPVTEIMNARPIVAKVGDSPDAIQRVARQFGVRHMPVVDEIGKLLSMEFIGGIEPEPPRTNWAVVMAGGLGTRLRPITDNLPKPLVTIGDRPILEIMVRHVAEQGIKRFFVSVNYKGHMIEEYFGAGKKWNVEIDYLREKGQLGTAGALSLLPERPIEPVLVLNGDVMSSVKLGQMLDYHKEMDASVTIGAFSYEHSVPFGVLEMDNGFVVRVREKPVFRHFVAGGIYVFSPDVLDLMQHDEPVDMPDLIERVISSNRKVAAFPIHEYWRDIGRLDDLLRAREEIQVAFPSCDTDTSGPDKNFG